MKRLRTLTGLMAICGMSVFMTGCGDDDEPAPSAPQNAPSTLAGNTYTLTEPTGNSTLAFTADGTSYSLTRPGSATETGTFTANQSGDTWNVTTTNGDATVTSTVTLTFNSANSGQFTYNRPGADPVTGNFSRDVGTGTADSGDADTGTADTGTADTGTADTGTADTGTADTGTADTGTADTGTADSGTADSGTADSGTADSGTADGGTGGGTVPAPAALQRLDITNTSSGTGASSYTVEFSGGATGTFNITSGSVGTGNYSYTPNGNSATLVMNYTDFPGDSDTLTLNFNAPSGSTSPSTHTGTQVVSGTSYPITGTFTYVAQ